MDMDDALSMTVTMPVPVPVPVVCRLFVRMRDVLVWLN